MQEYTRELVHRLHGISYDKLEEKKSDGTYRLHINNGKDDVVYFVFRGHPSDGMITVDCDIMTPSGEKRNIRGDAPFVQSGWQRISVSFNKRALKVYVNEITGIADAIAEAKKVLEGQL